MTTAVLTGALLVGDSMRGSLRDRALSRLGNIDELLVVDKFFRAELAGEVTKSWGGVACKPAIVLEGSVTQPDSKARAAGIAFFGLTDDWIVDESVYLNQSLADELNVKVGDDVILRLPAAREVPSESPLGRKNDNIANSTRLKVAAMPDSARHLADLTLRPNQQTPKNLFVSIKVLQKIIKKPDHANAIFGTAVRSPGDSVDRGLESMNRALNEALHPKLADYGLAWKVAKPSYFSLTSDRMLFEPALEKAVLDTYQPYAPQQVFTYLANTIASGSKQIPYSTIAALDMRDAPTLGPFRTSDGKAIEAIGDGEIVLTRWAAEDLGVEPGADIRVDYFEPDSTHGEVKETSATFKLKAIAEFQPNDPLISSELTPELPGVTDQLKMSKWDPPFPYDGKRVRDKDEKYWDDYRATPKAFVSQATGRRLWASRFGDMTSIRIAPQPGLTLEKLNEMFQPKPASVGFEFQPVRLRALEASSGTTPFEGLFIGFSFFIIASALMLTSLLFRLGVEQRAAEIGLLSAVGLDAKHVNRLLLKEGAVVAVLGAAIGLALGVGYANLMLLGLRTLWLDAVTVPFLELYVTPRSLAIGYATGVLVSLATIWWSLRSLRRRSIRRLLAGQAAESDLNAFGTAAAPRSRKSAVVLWVSIALAIVAAVAATKLTDEAQAGAFFGSAAFVLAALLTFLRRRLSAARFGSLVTAGPGRGAILALRNAGRNPGRSTLTVGLVASAAFLIVAVSAFRLTPPSTFVEKTSGTGGFALVALSDQPILPDLNTEDAQIDLGFSQSDREKLSLEALQEKMGDEAWKKLPAQERDAMKPEFFPFRFRPGDDASCLNLYQTTQPRILGAGDKFVERGGFSWAGTAATDDAERANPWLLLRKSIADDPKTADDESRQIPIVLDQATAIYSLHLSGVGATFDTTDAQDRPVTMRVVGLLRNSILQGSLVIHEEPFKKRFPEVSGYRYFLVKSGAVEPAELSTMFEKNLSDYGFDVTPTQQLLTGFLAVQNTYLSTFQSLGGLGLLLGTFGLAVVQLRNVLERRSELALLRAVGLSRSFLTRLVFWENLALLIGGLGCGVVAAATAVLPHALLGGASIPWQSLAATLGAVLVVGAATGWIVVVSVLKRPLLAALRGE